MKTLKYIIVILIFATLIFVVIKSQGDNMSEFDVDLSSEINAEQLCYIWGTESGDRAMLSMDIRSDKVIGEFYWLPMEKDSKTGIFRGTVFPPRNPEMEGRKIEGLWEAKVEDITVTEKIKIEFGDGIGGGVAVVESYPLLTQVGCGDEAMD